MKSVALATRAESRPWYREPWPWLLMIGPFVVVVAGIYTAWLAMSTSDGLVTENYYQEGLRAGETVARSARAMQLGIEARMRWVGQTVTVTLSAKDPSYEAPANIDLAISHPTRAGLDRKARLMWEGNVYRGRIELPASGHWLVLIEDENKSWRLMGSVLLPAAGEVTIGAE